MENRKACISFGDKVSGTFNINIDLHQGSSPNPYLSVVSHNDLIQHIGRHSCHIFADDLCLIVKPAVSPRLEPVIEQSDFRIL